MLRTNDTISNNSNSGRKTESFQSSNESKAQKEIRNFYQKSWKFPSSQNQPKSKRKRKEDSLITKNLPIFTRIHLNEHKHIRSNAINWQREETKRENKISIPERGWKSIPPRTTEIVTPRSFSTGIQEKSFIPRRLPYF